MSDVDTLRKAASLMRRDQEMNENLGRIDDREYATWLAVADWLEQAARLHEGGSTGPLDTPAALAVARAYLGEAS